MNRFAPAVFCLVFLAPLHAQKTYIVDQSNGTGAHFTNLVAAIKATAHGDLLELRKGIYTGPNSLSKALTFQGTTGVVIRSPLVQGFFPESIRIHSIPAGRFVASVASWD